MFVVRLVEKFHPRFFQTGLGAFPVAISVRAFDYFENIFEGEKRISQNIAKLDFPPPHTHTRIYKHTHTHIRGMKLNVGNEQGVLSKSERGAVVGGELCAAGMAVSKTQAFIETFIEICRFVYTVAKMHRMPGLYMSLSAKESYHWWLLCRKRPVT